MGLCCGAAVLASRPVVRVSSSVGELSGLNKRALLALIPLSQGQGREAVPEPG